MNAKSMGRQVRAARRRQALTQIELAALCGVGTRFVSDLENGKASIELGRMLQVTDALGLSVSIKGRDWSDIDAYHES